MDQTTDDGFRTFPAILDLLREHGDAGCADDGDVRACLRAAGIDATWLRGQLLFASIDPYRFEVAERSAAAILWVLTQADQEEVGAGFLKELSLASAAIGEELADAGPLEDHAVECIRTAIAKAFGFVARNGYGLRELTSGMRVIVEGEMLRLPYGDPVPMVGLLPGLSGRGLDLWLFRSSISEGRQGFDDLVARHWHLVAEGVARGLPRLLDAGAPYGLQPSQFLSAFPPAFADEGVLEALLSELVRRAGASDGFPVDHRLEAWLEAASRFECWQGRHLRTLTRSDIGADKAPVEYLRTLQAAVRDTWGRDRSAGVYGAFTLALQARHLARRAGTLDGVKRLEEHLSFVGDLPDSETVVWLVDRLRDVPSRLDQRAVAWSVLQPTAKAHWRDEIFRRLVDQPDVRRGLTEYILEWSGRADYDDMEPLLKDFVAFDGDLSLLKEMGASLQGTGSIRAGCLYKFIIVNPPFFVRTPLPPSPATI